MSRLGNLYERGIKNDVPDLKVVGPEEIREIEPNCVVNMKSITMWFFSLFLSVSVNSYSC